MNSILYANGKCEVGKRLQQSIEGIAPEQRPEIFRTIESFIGRLRRAEFYETVAILLAVNQKELFDLLSIRDLLSNFRIILILPDREMETISKGHSLYPRFLSYIDSDFRDVAAVLDKMMKIDHTKIMTRRERNGNDKTR